MSPDIGSLDRSGLAAAAAKSNAALKELAPAVHWEHSYVTGYKTFCVYVAENEDVIRRHAELSGFPATVRHGTLNPWWRFGNREPAKVEVKPVEAQPAQTPAARKPGKQRRYPESAGPRCSRRTIWEPVGLRNQAGLEYLG
jgi:hypothetical protein